MWVVLERNKSPMILVYLRIWFKIIVDLIESWFAMIICF